MKGKQPDNIHFAIGWLCGAVLFAAPFAAVAYLFLRRARPAFQAVLIGAVSLPCIIGARALMIASGVPHRQVEWIGLNGLVFLVVPSVATAITSAISWPRPRAGHPGRPRKS